MATIYVLELEDKVTGKRTTEEFTDKEERELFIELASTAKVIRKYEK